MKINRKLYVMLLFFVGFIPPAQCQEARLPESSAMAEINQVIDRGNTYFDQGQYDMAITEYSTAIEMKPNSEPAYWSRGRVYFFNKAQYSRAITDFDRAILNDSNYGPAYLYRGWSHIGNGAIDQAIASFSKAIELDNSLLTAINGRGWCYLNKAQWDSSSLLLLYQKFESDAGLTAAFKGKGWTYVKQMQWDLAVQPDPQIAIKQNPDPADLYCNIGFACFKKAQWDAAIADFDKALALDPTLNRSTWNRDWALGKKQEWTLVITDYGKIIALVSKQAIPVMEEGKTATLEFWYNNALLYYNKAIEQSKNPATTRIAKAAVEYINKWREDVREVNAPKCCGN